MYNQKVFMALALLSVAIACKKTSEKDKHANARPDSEIHHNHSIVEGVMLDNGKKWIANPETNQGIETMIQLIHEYEPDENVTELKSALMDEFQTIFQKCTMTGEAHQQLHNYLLPLKVKLDSLNDPINKEKIEKIGTYLAEYQNYFK